MNVHEPEDVVEAVKPVLYAIANAILFFFGCCVSFTKFIGFLYTLWPVSAVVIFTFNDFRATKGIFYGILKQKMQFFVTP